MGKQNLVCLFSYFLHFFSAGENIYFYLLGCFPPCQRAPVTASGNTGHNLPPYDTTKHEQYKVILSIYKGKEAGQNYSLQIKRRTITTKLV